MLVTVLFFLVAFATVAAMLWCGLLLLEQDDSPLDDRLEALQTSVGVPVTERRRRRAPGGVLNSLLYLISLVPGGEDWLRDTERELSGGGR
jgi:hypothetical protein